MLKKLISKYEKTSPEIVFEWNDSETSARGWVVINSLRGGAAGGGTRMRKGLNLHEVVSLAKTMEVKFTVSGPFIGGAKSGIDFDPSDPRRDDVLKRWFKVVRPLLKTYYGTGGDLNVDEGKDVVPITESYGIWHPQEGIVVGHFKPLESEKIKKIGQLRLGVPMVIANTSYSPDVSLKYSISDMITGFGVAQSVLHYYNLWFDGDYKGRSVIIQGWGNVGASAGFFLSKAGFKINGISDREGILISETGFSHNEIIELFTSRENNCIISSDKIVTQNRDAFWNIGAEIFLPCAGSRLVSSSNVNTLINNGCQLISSGANVPFNNEDILYGDVMKSADERISVIPDFIANCGMARTFAFCMEEQNEISSSSVFNDVSNTISKALKEVFEVNSEKTLISERALTIALNKLLNVS